MKIVFFSLMLLFPFGEKNPLNGRWESKPSAKGNVTGVVFKNDSILNAYVNKKPFTNGRYRFNAVDSTLYFVDNGCNGAEGIYKVLLFSNSDSLSFKVISDSCVERRDGMQRLIMGRVK